MKEFIEIPFGAKDSELGGWEYNIPEGYTASIENGKIIVKKEESKDEKIRKEIIDTIHRAAGNSGVHISEFLENKYIAWLEKQKPTDEEMKILLQTEYEKGKADAIAQRSAWGEEDEKIYNLLYEKYKDLAYYSHSRNKAEDIPGEILGWLKSLKDRVQPQWKPSEKQMKGIDCAIKTLRHQLNVEDKKLNSLYEDLKKLIENSYETNRQRQSNVNTIK